MRFDLHGVTSALQEAEKGWAGLDGYKTDEALMLALERLLLLTVDHRATLHGVSSLDGPRFNTVLQQTLEQLAGRFEQENEAFKVEEVRS